MLTNPLPTLLQRAGRAAIPLAWLAGVVAVVAAGFEPHPYLLHVRQLPPPHPYPTTTVLWALGFMTVHGLALGAILRPGSYARSWGRALCALGVSLAFLAFGAFGAMHAPPAWFAWLWWLLIGNAALAMLLLWSVAAAIRAHERAARR